MDGGDSQKFLLEKTPDLAPLSAQPGKAAVHICRGFKAEKSITSPAELADYIANSSFPPVTAERPAAP